MLHVAWAAHWLQPMHLTSAHPCITRTAVYQAISCGRVFITLELSNLNHSYYDIITIMLFTFAIATLPLHNGISQLMDPTSTKYLYISNPLNICGGNELCVVFKSRARMCNCWGEIHYMANV